MPALDHHSSPTRPAECGGHPDPFDAAQTLCDADTGYVTFEPCPACGALVPKANAWGNRRAETLTVVGVLAEATVVVDDDDIPVTRLRLIRARVHQLGLHTPTPIPKTVTVVVCGRLPEVTLGTARSGRRVSVVHFVLKDADDNTATLLAQPEEVDFPLCYGE
ncbi:MAG: hypothetical protein ACRDXX_18990 [Stackebrandtia sp.]